METKPEPARQDANVATTTATGDKPGVSTTGTLVHLLKGYVGTGIFALGNAMSYAGLILGPFALLICGLLNLYTQHQIVQIVTKATEGQPDNVRFTYTDATFYVFDTGSEKLKKHAKWVSVVVLVFLVLSELGFCCCYHVWVGEHIHQVTGNHGFQPGIRVMLCILFFPMWLMAMLGNLKLLMPLSITADILMLLGTLMIYVMTIRGLGDKGIDCDLIGPWKKYPQFFGTVIFAYAACTFVITLRNEMKDTTKMTTLCGVLNVGFLIVFIMYLTVGVLAYMKYGRKVASSVFLNFQDEGGLNVMNEVVKVMMVIGVMCTFALHMYVSIELMYPSFSKRWGPFKHPTIVLIAFKTLFVFATWLAALVIPYLGLFIDLVGSLPSAFLCLIMPPILHIIAFKETKTKMYYVLDFIVITVGVIGAVTGTVMALYGMVTSIIKDGFKWSH